MHFVLCLWSLVKQRMIEICNYDPAELIDQFLNAIRNSTWIFYVQGYDVKTSISQRWWRTIKGIKELSVILITNWKSFQLRTAFHRNFFQPENWFYFQSLLPREFFSFYERNSLEDNLRQWLFFSSLKAFWFQWKYPRFKKTFVQLTFCSSAWMKGPWWGILEDKMKIWLMKRRLWIVYVLLHSSSIRTIKIHNERILAICNICLWSEKRSLTLDIQKMMENII